MLNYQLLWHMFIYLGKSVINYLNDEGKCALLKGYSKYIEAEIISLSRMQTVYRLA